MDFVRDFRELVCWQLAHQLKCEILDLTNTGPVARDFSFRDQIRDSSASAPSNISEGFGRVRPAEFARYLEFARASLFETRNHLIDGYHRGYSPSKTCDRLSNLAKAAEKLTTRLMKKKQQARVIVSTLAFAVSTFVIAVSTFAIAVSLKPAAGDREEDDVEDRV